MEDHVEYWRLIRKEQATLHYAREKGLARVGLIPVPSKQVTKANAKQAIEMEMYLQSLLESPYGGEPWTMAQTSREVFLAAPEYTFKKQGKPVDIEFDGDSLNSVRETVWLFIYAQDTEGRWHKHIGQADGQGAYYKDADGDRRDYIVFGELAKRYGTTGRYKAVIDDTVIADFTPSGPSPDVATDSSPRERQRSPRTPKRPPGRRKQQRTPTPKRPGPSTPLSKPHTPTSKTPRPDKGRGSAGTPPSPGEVGRSHTLVPAKGRSRLQRLLQEAVDPPALVLTGKANVLKCFRYRVKKTYSKHFVRTSTTWYWTGPQGKERVGKACMLVMFKSPAQRQGFLMSVPIPTSIQSHAVSFFE